MRNALHPRPWLTSKSSAHTKSMLLASLPADLAVQLCVQTTQDPQVAEPLNWTKQWYPVHSTMDLDPAKPHAVNLLGEHMFCIPVV